MIDQDHKCNDCGDPPMHPGSVNRLVGKDASGNVIELCTKCWIKRHNDAAPQVRTADAQAGQRSKGVQRNDGKRPRKSRGASH